MSKNKRKLMWSAPLVAALAVVGALAAFVALAPNVAFAATPGQVTGLSATAQSDTQINLNWDDLSASPSVTSYKVEVSTDNAENFSVLTTVTGIGGADPVSAYNDTGLGSGQKRYYRVSGTNTDGTGPVSAIVQATTHSVPAAPTGLTATADSSSGGTEIDLSWTAVSEANNGGTPVTGYKIERSRSSSGPWTVLVATQSSTEYAHQSLSPGQTWYYQVSAINAVGAGSPATASGSTWKRPAAPTGFTAAADSMTGHTDINLSWSLVSAPEPDRDGSDPEDAEPNYVLFATTGGASALALINDGIPFNGDDEPNIVGIQLEFDQEPSDPADVAKGQTWHFQVAAQNDAGVGPRSAIRVVKTWTDPAAPTGLTATATSSTKVDLSWKAPTNTGGPGVKITGYQIERNTDLGGSNSQWQNAPSGANTNSTKTTFTDTVTAGASVHYRVSAITSVGTGAASGIAFVGALNVPAPPTKLKAVAVSGTQIDLSWTAPKDPDGAPVTGYKIEYNPATADTVPGDSAWSVLVADTKSTDTIYEDKTLVNGERRHYRVSAVNKAGPSSPTTASANARAWNKPGAPTLLTATADGPSRIKLSWQAPASTGGTDADDKKIALTGYKIQVSDDLGVSWSVLEAAYAGDSDARAVGVQYVHVDLMAGDQRDYQVSAINSVGTGDASNIADATTAGAAVKPGMPTMVEAATMGSDRIDVSWTAPADRGGAAITEYTVQRGVMAAGATTKTWTVVYTGAGMAYSDMGADLTPAGLVPETTYYYRVAATNSAGMGDYSDGTAMDMTYRVNTAPTIASAIGDQTVMEGKAITVPSTIEDADTGDSLEWSATQGDSTIALASSVDSKGVVTVTGVKKGTTTISVTATDQGVDGAAMLDRQSITQTFNVTVEPLDPSLKAPTGVTAVSNTANTLTFTWEGGENADLYILLAVDVATSTYKDSSITDTAARTGNITALTPGKQYLGIVVAVKGDDYKYLATDGLVTVE